MSRWKAFKEHATHRWTNGRLTARSFSGNTNHCALGIIGHLEGGEVFDGLTSLGDRDGYLFLRRNKNTREMVAQLAAALRMDRGVQGDFGDDPHFYVADNGGDYDQALVMNTNDRMGSAPLIKAADRIMECEAWLEAEREHLETERAARDIAKTKIRKKDLKVEYIPSLPVLDRVEEVVNGN